MSTTRRKFALDKAAVLALLVAVAGCVERGPTAAEAMTEQEQLRNCMSGWDELNRPVEADPSPRLTLRDDSDWLHVYVLDAGRWIATCSGGPRATSGGFGTAVTSGPSDELRFHGGYESVLKGRLLLGHPPSGTRRIEAELPSGQRLDGAVDGDLFVIWEPGGSVEGAQVSAVGADGSVLTGRPAPTEHRP